MPFRLPEPPAWWVKYKPLRWVLALLLLYWMFGTIWPDFLSEPEHGAKPLPAPPPTAEPSTPEPAEIPQAPAAPVEAPKPIPPATPAPAPVVKPPPVKPPAVTAAPKPPPKPAPVAPPKPVPVIPPKPAPAPAPVAKPAPVTPAEPEPPPAPDPAARYTQVEATRVSLINGLRSYDSVETIRAALEKAGYTVDASVIEKKPRGGRYPPYRNDTLVVTTYRHADFEGKLTLEFFNDRLYQTYFLPAKAADYLRWLRARGVALPVKRAGRSNITQGPLLISTNIDFASSDVGSAMRATPFVFWEDTRLTQQMKDWGPLR